LKTFSFCLLYYQNADSVVLTCTMEHVVTIDNGAPLAFDRSPLSIAREGMRGPSTPFSPELTVVLAGYEP